MEDRIEQIDLQDLQGMSKPEEFLWDPQSLPDELVAPPNLDDLPAAPQGLDTVSEESLGIKPKRLKSKIAIIPQREDYLHQGDLSAGDIAMINQRLRQQPFVWAAVEQTKKRSEVSTRLGWIITILIISVVFVLGAKGYMQGLEDIPAANLPNVSDSIQDKMDDLDLPVALALAGAGLIPFLMLLSMAFTVINTLRSILMRRPWLAGTAVLAGISTVLGLVSFFKDGSDLHAVSVCIAMLALLFAAKIWENTIVFVTKQRLKRGRRGA